MTVRDVIAHGNFDAFTGAMSPDIVWVGVAPGLLSAGIASRSSRPCGAGRRAGYCATPEIVGGKGNLIVVDPHVDPPNWIPELHHVFVVEADRIVEMRDYENRRAALEVAGL